VFGLLFKRGFLDTHPITLYNAIVLIFNNTEFNYYCVIIILLLLSEDKGRFTIAMRLQSMFGTAIPGVLLSYYPNNYLRHYHHYAELIYNTTQRGNTVHTISQRVNQHPPEHYLCRMDAVGQENTSSVYSCSIANHHANHSHVSMSPCSHQVPYLLTHIHSLPTLPMWDFHTYI
jgi:hypothetical protein